MRPNNIVIGQKYNHPKHPGTVYLGIGYRTGTKQKQLVIIESEVNYYVGAKVRFLNGNYGNKGFWDGIKKCIDNLS